MTNIIPTTTNENGQRWNTVIGIEIETQTGIGIELEEDVGLEIKENNMGR